MPETENLIENAKVEFLVELDLTKLQKLNELQCPGYDHVRQDWYLTRASARPGGGEDTRVHRFHIDGQYQSSCWFRGAGHGSNYDINDGVFTIGWDKLSGGKTVGRDIVRIDYEPGGDCQRSEGVRLNYTAGNWASPLARVGNFQATRKISGRLQTFRRHDLTVVQPGAITMSRGGLPLDAKVPLTLAYQGGIGFKDRLAALYGRTNRRTRIVEYDWMTGSVLSTLDVTNSLRKRYPRDAYEYEGLNRWELTPAEAALGYKYACILGLRLGRSLDPHKRKFIVGKVVW